MKFVRSHLPSPALAISVIALLVALGGTSYAMSILPKNSVGTKQLQNGAVTGKKIRSGAVTASKLNVAGVTVPNALHANTAGSAGAATTALSASTATTALSAGSATTAANANALGGLPSSEFSRVIYAHVMANGSVDASESKGIASANVTHPGASIYCFSGLPFTPTGGAASSDAASFVGGGFAEIHLGGVINCNSGEGVTAEVDTGSGTTFADEPFYIVLYG